MYWCQGRLLFRKLFVEVARVCGSVLKTNPVSTWSSAALDETHNRREVCRRNSLVHNIVEVNVLEEGMAFDLFRVALARTKTPCWVSSKKL